MSLKDSITSIPNILGGIFIGFLAIFGVRITYPILEPILDLFPAGNMYIVANLSMWLIYFFVIWVFVWAKMFQPKANEVK